MEDTARRDRTLKFLGIIWQLSSFTGFGVMGIQLALQLLKKGQAEPVPLCPPDQIILNSSDRNTLAPAFEAWSEIKPLFDTNQGKEIQVPFPALHAMADQLQVYSSEGVRVMGSPNLTITVFVNTHFQKDNLKLAERYHRMYAGSNWNTEIMRSYGIKNVTTWLQGVDTENFCPGPPQDRYPGRYVIFSGGKLEFRKGQDIVLEAFKRFHQRHPDALLLINWHNPWSFSLDTLLRSPYVEIVPKYDEGNQLQMAAWLKANGLGENSFEVIQARPNSEMPEVYRSADIALFPNRAEPATNLFAMESLACGLPVILSKNTGHLDLIESVECLVLEKQGSVESLGPEDGVEGWGESDVDEIIEVLEWGYQNREDAKRKGMKAHKQMEAWSWSNQVDKLLDEVRLVYEETT